MADSYLENHCIPEINEETGDNNTTQLFPDLYSSERLLNLQNYESAAHDFGLVEGETEDKKLLAKPLSLIKSNALSNQNMNRRSTLAGGLQLVSSELAIPPPKKTPTK